MRLMSFQLLGVPVLFTKNYLLAKPLAGNWRAAPALYHWQAGIVPPRIQFLLRSLPGAVSPAAIPGRLFSSSLPPSFVPGRFAAFLSSAGRLGRPA